MTAIRRFRPPKLGGALGRDRPRVTDLLARRLDITRGQASTMLVGLVLALVLALGGLPPVLRRAPAVPASLLGAPASGGSAPAAATPAGGGASAAPAAPAADPLLTPTPQSPSSFPTASGSFAPAAGAAPFDSSSPGTGTGTDPGPASGGGQRMSGLVAPVPGAAGVALSGERIVVASNEPQGDPKVVVLRADGSTVRSHPVRGRPDGATGGLTGVVIDDGAALVGDAATGRVLRVDLTSGAQRVYAQLGDLPTCQLVVAANSGCEPGLPDGKPAPSGLARAADGTLFVADTGQGAIWRIPPGGGRPAVLTTDLALSNSVGGIAVAADGSLLVASPEAVDPEAAGGGALYRVTSAGARSLLARFGRGEAPTGVALASGRGIVVTLKGAGAVVLLGEDGAEIRRVAGEAGGAAVVAPVAAAVGADGVYVSDRDGVLVLTEL